MTIIEHYSIDVNETMTTITIIFLATTTGILFVLLICGIFLGACWITKKSTNNIASKESFTSDRYDVVNVAADSYTNGSEANNHTIIYEEINTAGDDKL